MVSFGSNNETNFETILGFWVKNGSQFRVRTQLEYFFAIYNWQLLDLKVKNGLFYPTDLISLPAVKIIKLKRKQIEIEKQLYLFKITIILREQVIISKLQANATLHLIQLKFIFS